MPETMQNKKSKPTLRQMLPGLVISIAALAILFLLVDLEAVKEAIQWADYRYLPLTLLFFLATIAARSFGWRTILQEKISFAKAFLTENEGYMLNNVLPFRLGELGRALLLSQTTSLSFWEVLSTIMVERIFDVGIMAGLLIFTVPLILGAEWALEAALVAGGLVIAGFVALYLMARNKRGTMNLFTRLTKPWPRLSEFGKDKLEAFLNGLAVLRSLPRFSRVLFWLLLTWAMNVSWYLMLLWAFIPNAEILWAVFSVAVVSLGVSAPSTPAYIGVFEAVQVSALALFGVETSIALAYAVIAHSLYFIITVVIGAVGLTRDGLTLGEVFQQLRNRRA
jgi:uncharacterized protein (TIRG00374 family)